MDLGEVLGDVNIGNYTVRIGTQNGGVVNVALPSRGRSHDLALYL